MATRLYLPEYASSKLKCDLCRGYLSVPPISSYEDKFSCGRCNPGWPRNLIYEHLAQFAIFPCTYCEEKVQWGDIPKHEQSCRFNIILCPASYEKNYALRKIPVANVGEYHKDCQVRVIKCPFEFCDTKYEVKNVTPHFRKFHKDYIFTNNLVARKILKAEKVWNFQPDNQLCLIVFKQMPFLLFIHSDCNYNENTGDLTSYDYFFSIFTLCQNQCDIRYMATLTLESDVESSSLTMKNQEIKPFNENLHSMNFIRNGLIKFGSFNFMTTKFEKLKTSQNLRLTYNIKLLDYFEPSAEKYPTEKHRINIESLGKNFECPICKEYMCPPVYNCDMGHSVCKSCKIKMTICPFCKAYIGNSRNFVFEDILEALQIACYNEEKGCEFTGSVQDVKLHELICLFNG